jgi:molecular chaperone GrpE (heat shock protein)
MEEEEKDELQTLKDENLYLRAEIENIRKRYIKMIDDEKNRVAYETLIKISNIYDDFNRVFKLVDNETPLYNGLDMIKKSMLNTFNTLGLIKIDCDEYDDNLHEVISVMQSDKQHIDEVSAGWIFNDKVVKPSKVILYKNDV